jgi:hypothetical protein
VIVMAHRAFVVNAIRERGQLVAAQGLSGRAGGGLARDHQLRGGALAAYQALLADGRIRYTVYSYATPIAWVDADGKATVPDAYYSRTTSRHQGIAREALS